MEARAELEDEGFGGFGVVLSTMGSGVWGF